MKGEIISEVESVIKTLENGGVVIVPTDTVLGLGCNYNNEQAKAKIYELKKRDPKKPFAIFAPSVEWIFDNFELTNEARQFCLQNLPGAYTLLLNKKDSGEVFGVRIANSPFCLLLCKMLYEIPYKKHGEKIIFCATSVNLSGQEPATSVETINLQIKQGVDYIVDPNVINHPALRGTPSTVIDFSNGKNGVVVRK